MCGRTACTLAPDGICNACTYTDQKGVAQKPLWRDPPGGQQYYPSYNVSPGSHTPVILSSKHYPGELEGVVERVIQPMMWGLVPSWHKGDPKKVAYDTNNCRAEGMLEKRTYKVPLEKGRRCVVLADGFFEWKRDKTQKQPYFIYFPKTSYGDTIVKQEKIDQMCDRSDIKYESKADLFDTKQEVKGHCCELSDELEEKFSDNINSKESVNIKTELDHDIPNSEFYQGSTEIKTEPEDQTLSSLSGNINNNDSKPIKCEQAESITSEMCEDLDAGRRLLTMAGVFDVWNPPDGSAPLYSYSIITVSASPAMDWIHHRMPAILTSQEEVDQWINFGDVPVSKAVKFIRPVECVTSHPVSTVVNNSRNKTPDCVKPVDLKKPKISASGNLMMNWLAKLKKEEGGSTPNKTSFSPPKKKKKPESSLMMNWLTKSPKK